MGTLEAHLSVGDCTQEGVSLVDRCGGAGASATVMAGRERKEGPAGNSRAGRRRSILL